MTATGAGTRVDVTLKLSQLQNLCKRDPQGYREDYEAQVRRLESELALLESLGGGAEHQSSSSSLIELIQFAAAVSSSSYKGEESDRIAKMLMNLLIGGQQSSTTTSSSDVANINTLPTAALQLPREIRKTTVSALILMRNKGAIEPLQLMELFFRIMAVVPDKALREVLYRHMVNDIRNVNKKSREDKLNRTVQSFLHRVVSTHGTAVDQDAATDVAAKRATDMACELYRRRVWTDEKTVAILASAVESKNTTVMSKAIRFFLNIEEKMAQDEQAKEEEAMEKVNRIDYHLHSKKTANRQRQVERQLKNRKKARERKENADWMDADVENDKGVEASKKLYPAIELLRNPQGLAEAVLKRLKTAGSYKYETKLLMMNFVTRLVGNHELMLLPLYSFLTKYLTGHQRDVTAVLAYTVQACHEQVPPDEIYGLLKTIAHNFITERCSEEQMAVGINAARAICARVPSVMSEEESKDSSGSTVMDIEAFAQDLAAFANHRDRSVSIAGKGWTNFCREVNPGLLQGKTRGLTGSALHKAGAKPLRYGERKVALGVEGADLLVEYEAKKAAHKLKKLQGETEGGDDDGEEEDESDGWEEVEEDEGEEGESDDESAPNLVRTDVPDLSTMTEAEREKLRQEVSSTRVFTTSDFEKMRKLVEREQRAKRDPREKARRKRAIAKGREFEELSGDESESDDEKIRISGAVDPSDIMALARKKRQSKAERLEKVLAGRSKFEAKARAGGSTNTEKARKKNFLMSKFSREARTKGKGKGSLATKKRVAKPLTHEAKKRRRKV